MKIFIDHWITSKLDISRRGKTENVPTVELIRLISQTTKPLAEMNNDIKLLEIQGTKHITLMGLGDGYFVTGSDL